jgi:hypothetical protein
MGFFRRRPKSNAESAQTEVGDERAPFSGAVLGPRTVHERIEVTVEREWVSMVVRNPRPADTADGENAGPRVVLEAKVETEPKSELLGLERPRDDC